MLDIMTACAELPVKTAMTGEKLISEGDTGGKLFVLLKGELQVLKRGREITRVSEPGAIFGEMSALLGTPYSADVVATRPTRLYVSDDAERFIATNPVVALHAARILAERLHNATAYLARLRNEPGAAKSEKFQPVDRILDTLFSRT